MIWRVIEKPQQLRCVPDMLTLFEGVVGVVMLGLVGLGSGVGWLGWFAVPVTFGVGLGAGLLVTHGVCYVITCVPPTAMTIELYVLGVRIKRYAWTRSVWTTSAVYPRGRGCAVGEFADRLPIAQWFYVDTADPNSPLGPALSRLAAHARRLAEIV